MSSLSHPKYHRQRIVKYAQKHSVTKTALRYRVSRKTVYKWLSRYDGTLASLEVVLCQEKVQVKRGLFTFSESMKSYSAIFRNHVFQIIQFG